MAFPVRGTASLSFGRKVGEKKPKFAGSTQGNRRRKVKRVKPDPSHENKKKGDHPRRGKTIHPSQGEKRTTEGEDRGREKRKKKGGFG